MKVFVAGATGAVGKQLVPMLVEHGHEVTGMTRTAAKAEAIRAMGGRPAVADALDPEAVAQAVARSGARRGDPRAHRDRSVLASPQHRQDVREDQSAPHRGDRSPAGRGPRSRAPGGSSSRASRAGRTSGSAGPVKTEDDPLDDSPPKPVSETLAAIMHLESAVTGAEGIEGIALRYGGFYGPGTSITVDPPGAQVEMIRRRRFPIVGDGGGSLVVHPDRGCRGGHRGGGGHEGHRACTTSWTMIPRRSQSSCPSSPRWLAPSLRATSRAGSGVWSAARPR